MATVEEHKAIFRRFAEEAWNKGNLAVVAKTFAPEYHAHAQDPRHDVHGPQGHADFIVLFRQSFPDVHIDFEHLLGEGNFIVAHMFWTGTHTGEYMGLQPTGKKIKVTVVGINRFVGRKVVEAWGVVDTLGMLMQLGVIPPPASPPPQQPAAPDQQRATTAAKTPASQRTGKSTSMPAEDKKAMVRRYIEEVWNRQNFNVIRELFAEDYTIHQSDRNMPAPPEILEQGIRMAHVTFPDFHMTIEHMVEDGDVVAAHWTNRATHLGEFRLPGMEQGVPPSGNRVEFGEVGIFHIVDDKIKESWILADQLTMLQQVGLVPPQ